MVVKEWKTSTYFWFTAPVVGLIALLAIIFPKEVSAGFADAGKIIYTLFDWFVIWIPFAILMLCLYLAFSPLGKKRLGGRDAKPEYSLFSWISMLFTAGIGVGIIFYGPLEGLWHMTYSNYAKLPNLTDSERAHYAMSTAIWLWGIPAWAFYAISGVVIAYFAYNKKTQFTTAAPIVTAFANHKWSGPVAKLTMCLTIITVGISLASSLAMAAGQVNGGLRYILQVPELQVAPWILLGIFIIYSIAAITPINKGMKKLSDATIIVSLILMCFIFLLGPSRYFMMTFIEAIGNSMIGTVTQSFNLFIFDENRYWLNWFAMSYFIWWIGWTPFMGVFIAKISKGRTFRQMILASIFVPSGFILIWFSVFSGFGLLDTIQGSGTLNKIANGNYQETIYALLEMFPLSGITKPILAVLFVAFVVTTIVSGCITLGILTGKDGINPSKPKILIWGTFMSAIALPFVISGRIEGIKAIGSLAGFPYMFCFFITIAALIKMVRKDKKSHVQQEVNTNEYQ